MSGGVDDERVRVKGDVERRRWWRSSVGVDGGVRRWRKSGGAGSGRTARLGSRVHRRRHRLHCRRRRRHLGREDVFVVDEPSWTERRRRVVGQVESTTHTTVDDSGMMALRPNIRSRQPDIISQEAM